MSPFPNAVATPNLATLNPYSAYIYPTLSYFPSPVPPANRVSTVAPTTGGNPATAMVRALSGQRVLYPIEPVLSYIKAQWDNLLVTNQQLLEVLRDPKVNQPPGTPMILYISETENPQKVWQEL